jgi:hypothetical protein
VYFHFKHVRDPVLDANVIETALNAVVREAIVLRTAWVENPIVDAKLVVVVTECEVCCLGTQYFELVWRNLRMTPFSVVRNASVEQDYIAPLGHLLTEID